MSRSERERSHVVRLLIAKKLTQRKAGEQLGICVRQVKRLLRAYRGQGVAGLCSRKRGRPSPRRLFEEKRAQIVELLRGKYADFGPTLAAEKLGELDGIEMSRESVRRPQTALGLWKPKRRKAKRVFALRERRPRFGELIQIDGSPHDWFEGRAELWLILGDGVHQAADLASGATHASTTDKDARLSRKGKGQESKLAYLGHALMETRNGLVVGATATRVSGTAEREAATKLTAALPEGATLGADKGYDVEDLVEDLKARKIGPHVAVNGTVSKTGKARTTAVPPEASASEGYKISLRIRKRIEEAFGWTKIAGGLAQLKLRGLEKVEADFVFGMAAYNVARLPKLLAATGDVCPEAGT